MDGLEMGGKDGCKLINVGSNVGDPRLFIRLAWQSRIHASLKMTRRVRSGWRKTRSRFVYVGGVDDNFSRGGNRPRQMEGPGQVISVGFKVTKVYLR
jgi:hypothetical protein